MQQRQELTVHGYVKRNYKQNIPIEIIEMIYKFYLLFFDTKIMNDDEQLSLVNLVWNELKKHDNCKDMRGMNFDLLYRASENEYSATKFHQKCDEKGATITIAHNNEYDSIFGGYASESWPKTSLMTRIKDPNAFLFTIRPKAKVFGLVDKYKDGADAITSHINYGPVFGIGTDLYIGDECNKGNMTNASRPKTYEFNRKEFLGADDEQSTYFLVDEYEVFTISVQ